MSCFKQEFEDDIEREMYLAGAEDALRAFGVWRDGTQYINDRRAQDCLNIILAEIPPYKDHKEIS